MAGMKNVSECGENGSKQTPRYPIYKSICQIQYNQPVVNPFFKNPFSWRAHLQCVLVVFQHVDELVVHLPFPLPRAATLPLLRGRLGARRRRRGRRRVAHGNRFQGHHRSHRHLGRDRRRGRCRCRCGDHRYGRCGRPLPLLCRRCCWCCGGGCCF